MADKILSNPFPLKTDKITAVGTPKKLKYAKINAIK